MNQWMLGLMFRNLHFVDAEGKQKTLNMGEWMMNTDIRPHGLHHRVSSCEWYREMTLERISDQPNPQ